MKALRWSRPQPRGLARHGQTPPHHGLCVFTDAFHPLPHPSCCPDPFLFEDHLSPTSCLLLFQVSHVRETIHYLCLHVICSLNIVLQLHPFSHKGLEFLLLGGTVILHGVWAPHFLQCLSAEGRRLRPRSSSRSGGAAINPSVHGRCDVRDMALRFSLPCLPGLGWGDVDCMAGVPLLLPGRVCEGPALQ